MHQHYQVSEEAYSEWIEYRQVECKKKIGPMAEKKQRKMLSAYPPPVQQEIIDQSIMNSWQGLFPPKESSNGNAKGHTGSGENTRRLSAVERVKQARWGG